MRLLVTGAAGFIGTQLRAPGARRRRPRGARRRAAGGGRPAHLRRQLRQPGRPRATDPRFRFERLDIARPRRDGARCCATRRVDVVVNFAAEIARRPQHRRPGAVPAHQRARHPRAAGGGARRRGVRRFLQVSTDEVYGSIAEGHATEDWPARPSSPYAASKTAADAFVQAYATTLRGAGRHHALLEQLRPVPVPGEADPAVRHQRARRRAAPALRRRPERARLDPRRATTARRSGTSSAFRTPTAGSGT